MRSALLVPLTSLVAIVCLACGTSFAQDHSAIDLQKVLAQFDIYKDGDALIVPVEIAGKTYRFAVSTGCPYTTFDTSLAGLLGTPIATSPTGPKWYLEPIGKVGNASLQTGKPAQVMDMARLGASTGHTLDGILGMPFLSTQVIHLDFDRGKLYFLKGPGTQAGDSVPLHFDPEGTPVVGIEVPDAGTRWFLLNTGRVGCVGGNLDKWTFAALQGKRPMTRLAEIRSACPNGTEVCRWGEVRGMSLAPISLPPVYLQADGRNELGLGFLTRFNLTFDFPGRRLYLSKSKCFGDPDPIDRSGMCLQRLHGDTIVSVVAQGGPAEASGIRPGDVILEIAGKNASELRLKSLKLLFCPEGTVVPMTIRRGKQEIPVTLRLGSWPLKPKESTDGARFISPSNGAAGPEQHGRSDAAHEHK